jgi:type IV pilus assembly protein PilC
MSDPVAFIAGSNLVVTVGVLSLMVTRCVSGPAPEDRKSIFRTCLRAFAWVIIFIGFAASSLAAPALGVVNLLFNGLGTIWIVSVAAIIAMAYGKQAATHQYAMLALLGAASERAMPLEGVFAAFGQERGGWMQRRARRISHLLLEGVPLPVAVEKVPGVLPPEAVPLVRVGYDTGTLPAAVRQVIATRNFFEPVWQSIVPKILYICIFPAMAAGLLVFMAVKIIPLYEKIFKDFGMYMPTITRWIITCVELPNLPFVVLGASWLAAIVLATYVVLRYAGSIHWDLPGTAWLLRRRHTATILDGLALAAEQQKPFANAVVQLAVGHPQRKIARRLWDAYDLMQAGENDLEALLRVGLLSKDDLALLHTAERNGNFAWAARELADSHRRRMIYRTYAAVQAIFPPVIIGYGAIVVVICAAMFLPLICLIYNLSPAQ